MTNPLLDLSALPRFGAIRPEHVTPAIQLLIDQNRTLIAQLCEAPGTPDWDSLVVPITDAGERLGRAWGVVGHMHSVMDTPEWREAYNGMLPEVSRFYAETGHNLKLFEKYKALHASPGFASLSPVRQRILDHELRDFRLCGAELPDELKPRFQDMQETQSALAAKFSENLLDATNAHAEWIEDESVLSGLPDDVRAAARSAAERAGKSGWKLTLQMPSYLPVMQYAENRDLRARMYRAYATRASESGPAEFDNGPLVGQILALRNEEARMLGYRHYADASLVTKMAESTDQVLDFLRELAHKAKPFAERDLSDLREFALTALGLETLEPWDMAYASEKLRQARYAFSELEVKHYFPQPKVIEGLFRVAHVLYGIDIVPESAEKWDPDVDFYRIERSGETIGHFFLDLHARETKRGGAWMDSACARQRTPNGIQTPVAYLVCNFSGPGANKPATFTHDDVQTLFHEFGHGLHGLMTKINYTSFAGTGGSPRDYTEFPAQLLEHWTSQPEMLELYAKHYKTGEVIPTELVERMLAAKNHNQGFKTTEYIAASLLDLRWHMLSSAEAAAITDAHAFEREILESYDLIDEIEPRYRTQYFSHTFAGGYSAGYYAYLWSEILDSDAFNAFKEAEDIFDPGVAARARQWIYEAGGLREADELYRNFRGADPSIEPLLEGRGFAAEGSGN